VLVPPGDAEALSTQVLRLLADQQGARRLADAAQRWITEKFSVPAAMARLESLYEERLSKAMAS
jgi:glycosyltransferase involved in cell wall biosynthesis